MENLIEQPEHENESRKMNCEPASREGADDEGNGALRHMPRSSQQNAEQELGFHPNTDKIDVIVLNAQNNTEV